MVANAFVEGRDVDGPYERAVERIAAVKEKLRRRCRPAPGRAAAGDADGERRGATRARPRRRRAVASSMTREQYEAGVERIREYIYAGDAFQVVPAAALQHAGRRRRRSRSTAG